MAVSQPRRKGTRLNAFSLTVWLMPIVAMTALELQTRSDEVSLAHREVFWNIRFFWLVYLLLGLMMTFTVFWAVRRSYLWRAGKPVPRMDEIPTRLKNAFVLGLMQKKVRRDPLAALAHICVSSSIFVLFLVTATLFVDHYAPGVLGHFLHGPRYLGYSLVADVFGFIGIFGLGIFAYMRIAGRKRLRWDVRPEDAFIWGSTLTLILTGFAVEGLRIFADEINEHEFWSYWSPGGWLVAKFVDLFGTNERTAEVIHASIYWVHIPLAFVWMAVLARTKLSHVITAPANAFFKSTKPVGRLEPIKDFDPTPNLAASEMKLSALAAIGPNTLLVDERTDNVAKIYKVDLSKATNILGTKWDDPATAPLLAKRFCPSCMTSTGSPSPGVASYTAGTWISTVRAGRRPVRSRTSRRRCRWLSALPATVVDAERDYLKAIAKLSKDVESERGSLDPVLRNKLERPLTAIDQNILTAREAVRKNPNDPTAVLNMFAAYDNKMDVLQQLARYQVAQNR